MSNLKEQTLLIITFCMTLFGYCQNVVFTDLQLKQYLITENCVDTDNDGFADANADFNNDNQIQVSEAESILNLYIDDLHDNYAITSIQDISNFSNLIDLTILQIDDLTEISNLGLDNLKTFRTGSCLNLTIIDISDLTNLTAVLRIEDIPYINYLNIQNGSVAQFQSFFYSEDIEYACIDNITAEYDDITWRMTSGTPTINNCATLSVNEFVASNKLILFPNPTADTFQINTTFTVDEIIIYNTRGVLIKTITSPPNHINIKNLDSGIYFVGIQTAGITQYKKLIKK